MGTSERRYEIMKTLCRCRHEKMHNLAREFGVSTRTIQRDIEVLSRTEPIYTQSGKYGGVGPVVTPPESKATAQKLVGTKNAMMNTPI